MAKFKNQIKKIVDAVNNVGKFNFLVGIDGCGGAGKTTLAAELADVLPDVFIIHFDDFYKPKDQRIEAAISREIGSFFDWQRLKKQVLTPYTLSEEVTFQKYDWQNDTYGEWITVPENCSLIVEGVYSTRKEIAKYYDVRLWIDTSAENRMMRGMSRGNDEKKEYWDKLWASQEDKYIKIQKPQNYAHLIIDGNGR